MVSVMLDQDRLVTPKSAPRGLYLDLLRSVLTRILWIDHPIKHELRFLGKDWPEDAETMIGVERLDNIRQCIESAVKDAVPGDVMECGVWKGGAAIDMRAVLRSLEGEESSQRGRARPA